MKYKNILVLLFTGLMVNISCPPLLQAVSKVQFTIVYTNDVMGEVEPCG